MTHPTGTRPAARIFLVGLMGAGKSSVGTALAEALGRPYLDNDVLLRAHTGLDAPAWQARGGRALHDEEDRQVGAVAARPGPFVAGVAASVADRPDRLNRLAAAGTVVYLRAAPATLAGRVGRGEGRPWLNGDPLPVLEHMFAARDNLYRRASTLVVDTEDRSANEVAAEIARRLTSDG